MGTTTILVGHVHAPPEQAPLAQSAFRPHFLVSPHFWAQPVPQSTSVSLAFFTLSKHVGPWQTPLVQTPLVQSPGAPQNLPTTHGAQIPPQSLSLSFPFF